MFPGVVPVFREDVFHCVVLSLGVLGLSLAVWVVVLCSFVWWLCV